MICCVICYPFCRLRVPYLLIDSKYVWVVVSAFLLRSFVVPIKALLLVISKVSHAFYGV